MSDQQEQKEELLLKSMQELRAGNREEAIRAFFIANDYPPEEIEELVKELMEEEAEEQRLLSDDE